MQIPLMQIPTRLNFPSKCANHYLRPTFEQEMKNNYKIKPFQYCFKARTYRQVQLNTNKNVTFPNS